MSRATYHWDRLPTGQRLAVATLPDSDCAAFTVHVPAGSRDEINESAGLAHFVEHMVFKGTERRSARQLTLELESSGAQVNACTTEDQTVYDARGDAEGLPVIADILCDMVWRSTFPAGEMDLEREVICEEITMYRENPSDHIGDLISNALWQNHPLGHPISGTQESVAGLGRLDLCRFRDEHHFRDEVVLSVAGPFAWDEVAELLEIHLPRSHRHPAGRLGFDRASHSPAHLVEERDTEQVQLSLAWHTPGRSSTDRHALRLLSLMLGETAGSRLFLELREELGLCYQISSDLTLFHETGALEVHVGLEPDASQEAQDRICRQLQSFADHGPVEGELARAKRLAIVQGRIAMETTSAHASWAGEGLLDFGRIPTQQEWKQQVEVVTDLEIQSVARRLMQSPPSIAEIRPR